MKKVLIGLIVLLVIGVAVYLIIPSGHDVGEQVEQATTGEARQPVDIQVDSSDVVFPVTPDNTRIGFACSKTVAGKVLDVRGGWSGSFDSVFEGRIVVDPESGTVRSLEADIDVGSLWSEHDILTDALLHKGFFQVDEHPRATLVSTAITPVAAAPGEEAAGTHRVEGNLKINGIERSVSFPASIEVTQDTLKLKSEFSIDRKEFNVNFVDTVGFLLTDENIHTLVAVKVSVDAGAAEAPGEQAAEVPAEAPVEAAAAPVAVEDLEPAYTETIPLSQVTFDMVLVPGNGNGVGPLYVGSHEVTWDEFMPWVDCDDIEDPDEASELRARKLRPSPPYEDVTRGFGLNGYPALSMSQLSAGLYCDWLSEQTGQTYRLPTEDEWEHVYAAGGLDPDDAPAADLAESIAVFSVNSEDDFTGDWATRPVGSMEPNELGLFDMAGNVCEWVTDTGTNRVARGGHFESELADLGAGRAVEDRMWNLNYPNVPKSIWWFVDARWVGFRLVREP